MTDEEWTRRLAERAERYAALHEPTEPPEPPAPSPQFTEADAESMRQALETELAGFGAELRELLRAAREAQEQEQNAIQEIDSMATNDQPIVLNESEKLLIQRYREAQADLTARAALSAEQQAEAERIDSLASKALRKREALTGEEATALRSRIISVLGEMNGARSS